LALSGREKLADSEKLPFVEPLLEKVKERVGTVTHESYPACAIMPSARSAVTAMVAVIPTVFGSHLALRWRWRWLQRWWRRHVLAVAVLHLFAVVFAGAGGGAAFSAIAAVEALLEAEYAVCAFGGFSGEVGGQRRAEAVVGLLALGGAAAG
jgi:hypothetical protein